MNIGIETKNTIINVLLKNFFFEFISPPKIYYYVNTIYENLEFYD